MFFSRKTKAPIIIPFNQRVAAFWTWFAEQSARFYETLESGKCPDLTDEVSAKCEDIIPGLAWVFGADSEAKGGHSFTLSPEGNSHKRLLTEFWLSQAPELPGWTFYASRQPSHDFNEGIKLEINGQSIKAGEIWVTLHAQRDSQVINLSAWHPAFSELPENAAYQIIFIMLDEALGEDAVENHIGDIHIRNDKLAKSVPIHELRQEVESIRASWQAPEQFGAYSIYRLPEPDDSFIRSDTLVGNTRHRRLINDFLGERGQIPENPFEGMGAEFVFVSFPSSHLPRGEESSRRGEIEEAIEKALKPELRGECIGGATGARLSYIDLLLYDPGEETKDKLREALAAFGLTGEAKLHPFIGNANQPLCEL
ncbi:hypothetical protein [Cerasicoccus frondis]|uniref:hypothetical protein n=1 Tax=Cerasicoccus frondis TaxID=490090 RepID=UPI00285297AB|nr:hypothetical protein [Cerasicoccus frondis]